MLNIIKNTINRVFASGVDSDASAFITATGLSGTTQKSAITTLVKDLKSSGLWSKMKAVYPMVTDNVNQLSYTTTFNSSFYRTDGTSSFTNNYAVAPDGTNTATRMVGNATKSYWYYNINDGLASGNRTYSIYLKAGSDTQVTISLESDGTAVSQSLTLTSSWQRFQLTKNITNTSSAFYITVDNVGSGLDILMWGVQVEFGTTASAYQPILTTPSAFMASQMKYNLKDPRDLDAAFRLTWSGGWTYSATGATPNGTNAYADTKFIPNTSFTSNNSSFSVYSRTDNINGGDVMGTTSGIANRCFMFIRYGANQSQINHNSGSVLAPTTLTSLGTFLTSRTALGHRYYVNNALSASSNLAETGLSTVSFYIGADNTSGSAANYTNRQFAFSHIGDGLTDQESFLFNQIVEKYQVALSRGVQAAQSFYYNSAYSNEANTYLYSTQITGTTQVSAINTLINGLKANNLWTKMKAVYPFVTDKTLQADMAAQMKFNLVNPQDTDAAFRLAFSGGWTYSTNGAQPNGTNGYADTKLVPSTTLGQDNAHLSYYSRTNNSFDAIDMGTFTAALTSNQMQLIINYTGNADAINNSPTTITRTWNTDGLFISSRTASTSYKSFRNDVLIANRTISTNGNVNRSVWIGGRNSDGAYTNRQTAFASIGDGLTDAEALLLYQLIQAFQTTLSRNI